MKYSPFGPYKAERKPRVAMSEGNRGFTLVELMVVVIIMAMLAAIVLGISGYASRKSAESRARADLENIRTALEEYRMDEGRYPGTISSGNNPLNFTPMSDGRGEPDPRFASLTNYVADIRFEDPWSRPYRYQLQSRFTYRVLSTGPNERERYDDIE